MMKTKTKKINAAKRKKLRRAVVALVAVMCAAVTLLAVLFVHNRNKPADYTVASLAESGVDTADIFLIAHRGFRAMAPENTAPAYEKAGQAGYRGAECDIYRTSDGVWVLHHDSKTGRMMNCNVEIEKTPYTYFTKLTEANGHLKHYTDNGHFIEDYPFLPITTLQEYLDICDKYGMTAVIELKGENNREHYGEIMEITAAHTCDVQYISFGKDNLLRLRTLGAEEPMFLLVHNINDDAIAAAQEIGNCGISFNADVRKNLENDGEAIRKITAAGLYAAAWTVDSPETVQALDRYGVTYITTNCLTY